MADVHLTADRLREVLKYDEQTGIFHWRVYRGRMAKAGDIAGALRCDGYIDIKVNLQTYKAHRLAWLHVHSVWPSAQIDHKNGVRHDNRINNLRAATTSENMQNLCRAQCNGKTGLLGVTQRDKRHWVAQININGKRAYLGYFSTPEQAHAAYVEAKRQHHPFGML